MPNALYSLVFIWGYLQTAPSALAPVLVVLLDGQQILRASVCGIDQPEFDGTQCSQTAQSFQSTFPVVVQDKMPLIEFNWIFPVGSGSSGNFGVLSDVEMTFVPE